MSFMDIKNYTALDICKIIKSASECGVKSLCLGDVKIEYAFSLVGAASEKRTHVPAVIPSQDQEVIGTQIENQAIEEEKTKREDQDLDELLLSDPVEYFKQIQLGVLDGHTKAQSTV